MVLFGHNWTNGQWRDVFLSKTRKCKKCKYGSKNEVFHGISFNGVNLAKFVFLSRFYSPSWFFRIQRIAAFTEINKILPTLTLLNFDVMHPIVIEHHYTYSRRDLSRCFRTSCRYSTTTFLTTLCPSTSTCTIYTPDCQKPTSLICISLSNVVFS